MNKYNHPEPVSIYTAQDHSQGMVLPTVDRSPHLSESTYYNFPQYTKKPISQVSLYFVNLTVNTTVILGDSGLIHSLNILGILSIEKEDRGFNLELIHSLDILGLLII